ncbi:UNVERIFIED_ORG: hypothetical protein LHJ69_12765 [Shinella sp. XGS7]|nr:hypothetical protein [Shinella sp. XGS7]
MQTPLSPTRANRVPRLPAHTPSLCRRLYLRCALFKARMHLQALARRKEQLQHDMALDQAALLVHRLQYTKSPVLQARMAAEQQEFAELSALVGLARADVKRLETELDAQRGEA